MTPWKFLESFRGRRFSAEWPTVIELFAVTCERFPDRPCFTSFEPRHLTFTFSEAAAQVERVADHLAAKGIRHGDKVAVTGKNSPEWAIAYLAVLSTGATVVPLDYQLTDEEISGLLELSDARLLFVDEEKLESLSGRASGLLEVISLSTAKPGYLLDLPESPRRMTEPAALDETAAILYTSGTTGHAKGVMLSHHNLVSDCFLSQTHLALSERDVFYALLPIHHSYTMLAVLIEALSVGAQIVFGKRLAVTQILSDLSAGKVTMFLGIPMLFNKLLKGILHGIRERGLLVYGLVRFLMTISGAIKKLFRVNPGKRIFHAILAKASLDKIRICISGGGPLPAETFRAFNQLGIDFVQGYGLTETSPIVTLNPIEHYKETSVGKVIPQIEVKILDPDEVGVGEILVKGPIVMQGYYKNAAATQATFTEDGYLLTGDVGYLDDENYLFLTGRKKSLIVTEGGKNVFPEEIEDYFQLYEEIEQVLVKGYLRDPKMKVEGIEAYVYPSEEFFAKREPQAGGDRSAVEARIGEIVAEVNRKLLFYKRIDRFRLLDAPLEMTTTRKIKRFMVT